MEKLTTVDIMLLLPILNKIAGKGAPISPLFKDLHDKMHQEFRTRPIASVEAVIQTIAAYEPRTTVGAESLLQMVRLGQMLGIKNLGGDE